MFPCSFCTNLRVMVSAKTPRVYRNNADKIIEKIIFTARLPIFLPL